jgi:hypothetical protein
MNNFEPARPNECVLETVDEMDLFHFNHGFELSFSYVVILEEIATETVERWLSDLTAST